MKIFELETPVMKKIETVVNARKAAGKIGADQKILFMDYEPDKMFIHDADYDGAVAVYASSGNVLPGESSATGDQVMDEFLTVDFYGFGDPIKNADDPTKLDPTTREAQNRAQVLLWLGYNAIMDRQEIAGSTDVPKGFDSTVDFGADKYPVSWQKFSPMGPLNSRRGAVIYRFIFRFKLDEPTITEPLGIPFAGSDNITSDTYDPGAQPEGV